MQQHEFDREITRLRNHFGDRHYSNEIVAIFWKEFGAMSLNDFRSIVLESIATHSQARAPLRDDFKNIADRLGINSGHSQGWQYFVVDDCLRCGGDGWFFIKGPEGREATRCCPDCAAGRNLMLAKKPTVTESKIPQGWEYSRPSRSNVQGKLHPELEQRFGSWDGLNLAIKERRMSQASGAGNLISKLAINKSVKTFLENNQPKETSEYDF